MGAVTHEWVSVHDHRPMLGARIIAFTPVFGPLRFRVIDSDLLSTLSEATHWAYLQSPPDHDIEPSSG